MPVRRQTRSGRSRPASPSPTPAPPPADRQATRNRTPSPRCRRPARETPRGSFSRSRSPRRRIRFEDEIGDRAAYERELAAARRQKRRDTSDRTPSRGSSRATSRPPRTPDRRARPSPIRRTWGPDLTRPRAGINEALRRNEHMIPGQSAPDGLDEDVDDDIQREIEEDRARQRAIDRGFLFSAAVVVRVKRGSVQTIALKKDVCLGGDRPWCGASSFDMDMLNEFIDDAVVSKHLNPQFESIAITIKSPKANVGNEGATMGELTREEFSNNVEPVLSRMWRSSPGYELMIYININALPETVAGASGATASATVPSRSEPPSTPPRRRTRTVRLEEQAAANRDANEAAGNYTEKLIDKWRCHSDTCRNHGNYCWIPPHGPSMGKHFSVTEGIFDLWSNTLRDCEMGDNNLQPPDIVVKLLSERGPVEVALKHPSAKERKATAEEQREEAARRREEAQDKYISTFYKQSSMQMEIQGIQSMQMMQQQQAQMSRMQMPLDPPSLPRFEPQNPPPIAQTAPTQTAPIRSQSPNASSTNTTQISMAELGRSSPLAERTEEELAWDAFWQWKCNSTERPAKRQTYQEVKRVCDAHFWGFEELKSMSDRRSDVYRLGSDADIPDGLMKRFRDDLVEFKPYWRNVCRPHLRVRLRERERSPE